MTFPRSSSTFRTKISTSLFFNNAITKLPIHFKDRTRMNIGWWLKFLANEVNGAPTCYLALFLVGSSWSEFFPLCQTWHFIPINFTVVLVWAFGFCLLNLFGMNRGQAIWSSSMATSANMHQKAMSFIFRISPATMLWWFFRKDQVKQVTVGCDYTDCCLDAVQ